MDLRDLPELEVKGLAYDLDETLFWTVFPLMLELQKKYGNPEGLTVEQMIEKYRYTWNVPNCNTEEARAFVHSIVGSDEFQAQIPVIKDAVEAVNKIHGLKYPVALYLTARPTAVYGGTKRALLENGFPLAPIVCRPDHIPPQARDEWKARVLEYYQDILIGIVDDSPGLIEHLSIDYPGKVYLFNHDGKGFEDKKLVVARKTWKLMADAILGPEYSM